MSFLLPTLRRATIHQTSTLSSIQPSTFLRSTTIPPHKASYYHSQQHAPPPLPFNPTETAILTAALAHVPVHGFSNTALTLGSRDAGFLDITTNLFPRGPFDIVNFYLVGQRRGLGGRVRGKDGLEMEEGGGVGKRIRRLCRERLQANVEMGVAERWSEALALMALPSNLPTSLSELAQLSDEMWYLSGDTSVDTSWYTKRASLAAVYSSTELFMTQDRSQGYADTWEFLDRRLRDVSTLGWVGGEVGRYLGFKMEGVVDMLRAKSVIR